MTEPTNADILKQLDEHEQHDDQRFGEVRLKIESSTRLALAGVADQFAAHEKFEAGQHGAILETLKPMSEEIVGTKDLPGMRERLRTLEAKAANIKWFLGLLSVAVVAALVPRFVELLSRKP